MTKAMKRSILICSALLLFLAAIQASASAPILGPELLVQADGIDIDVSGYSVPSFVCWNGDTLKDLVVGEGSGNYPDSKVRVYINVGSAAEPQFLDYLYVQSIGADLTCPGSG